MKWFSTGMLTVLAASGLSAAASELHLLPDAQPQCVFAGDARKINVIWHNAGDKTVDEKIHLRMIQTTSATAVLSAEVDWKELETLPHQTVLESARLDFPEVKAETKFLIQWLADADTNATLGVTEVRVYPTNLLAELKPLVKGTAIGVYDPQNELKPLLKKSGIELIDLKSSSLANFSGTLVIAGPFTSLAEMPDDLAKQIKALAKKNVAVVWILPQSEDAKKPVPSFYSVAEGTNFIAIVQPDLVCDLPESPQAQRNLIYFCELALNPQPPVLPDLTAQP
jgi:hypothetical protein